MGNRFRALALVVVIGVGAACGGGEPSPPPPPPDTGGPPPSGSSPGQPSTPTQPSTPSTPSAPPASGAPPAGTTPPPDATPPTVPAACAGLVPENPGPGVAYALERATGGIAACDAPVTDGRGEWIGVGAGYHSYGYGFVRAASPGERTGSLSVPRPQYGGSPFAPQPDGYHAVRTREMPGAFLRFDATGGVLAEDGRSDTWAIQGVPGGGSVVLRVEGLVGGGVPTYRLEWMDGAGARRAEAAMPRPDPAFVVAASGNVLALAAGQARWFGRDGAPLTDWFAYDPSGGWSNHVIFGAAALADGSVVVGLGGARPLRFEGGVAGASPPPAWVTSRAGATIAAVRGGRANAFASVIRAAPCEARVEILTPAGESCGTIRLEAALCDRVTFGADRTVFTTHESAEGTCTWHWWSGLLR